MGRRLRWQNWSWREGEPIRFASVGLARTVLISALASLAVWEATQVDGPLASLVGAIGRGGWPAAALAGLAGLLLVRLGRPTTDVTGLAARTAIKLGLAGGHHESFWTFSPDSLFSVQVGEDGQFIFSGINPAHERLTGLHSADMVGKSPQACLPAGVAAAVSARYRDCIRCGQPTTYEETLDLPGGVRHWRTSLVPVRHPVSGRIVLLFGSARDITTDRRAHQELSRLNEHLNAVVASITDCYCILDNDYRLTFANAAALRWAGKDAAAVVGKSYRGVYTPESQTGRAIIRAMERREVVHAELPSATQPGRWLQYNLYPTPDGGLALFFRDVTEIREAREALKELPRQILASQENERRRIASELHDSTTQHIVAANLNLMRLGPSANQVELRAREDIQRSLDEALQELRVFTYLLHPPALHRDGLVATLHTFLDGFGHRAHLDVVLWASARLDELSHDLQHAVFRVVQEALSNTHRHADATRVVVQARLVRGTLYIRISDDGQGMPIARNTALDFDNAAIGVGLPGMRARLKQFGGDLRVSNAGGGKSGAVVLAIVPLARQARSVLVAASSSHLVAVDEASPSGLSETERQEGGMSVVQPVAVLQAARSEQARHHLG